ncbi:MAG: nuclear transport factor 2 family protein [Salinirussus sp.]
MPQNDVEHKWRIAELKYRYLRAIDEDDTESLLNCFTEDAVIDHVDGFGHMEGREEYAEWCRNTTAGAMNSMHMAMNPLIDVDGEEANGRSNFLVIITQDDRAEIAQGSEQDAYRLVDGEWKHTHLKTWRNFTIDISDLGIEEGRGDSVTGK